MAKSRKPGRLWAYSPAKDPATRPSAPIREEVDRKAKELIESTLAEKFIRPAPADPRFNYVIGLSTKWRGRFFYLVLTYACPPPDALSPTFDHNLARLEHAADHRFNLAFLRHTGEWCTLLTGATLDECLASVRDDPWFQS